jgi:cobalt-zinc-cadmium efflux system outer membrane protein
MPTAVTAPACRAVCFLFVLAAPCLLRAEGLPEPQPTPPPQASLSLSELEQIALRRNPTLAQASSQVDVSAARPSRRGSTEPTAGYDGEQMGVEGTAGERQGAFVQQEIVTAGKLRLSRSKYAQESVGAELQAQAQHLRVLNGLRVAFFHVLAAERTLQTPRPGARTPRTRRRRPPS